MSIKDKLKEQGKGIVNSDLGFDFLFVDGYTDYETPIIKHIKEIGEYRITLTIIHFADCNVNYSNSKIVGKKVKLRIFTGEISENNKSVFYAKLPNNFDYSLYNCLSFIKEKNIELYDKIINSENN